jgi:2-polyprenyl-6-methoxyphenol hydroxylase-like FAD-dependent oxidoreductase
MGTTAMRIAINGAGIAGPTLAYWLRRSGHEVLLVEHAPRPRTGGYIVDFWGLGYDIAERMGVLDRIREAGYLMREVRFVDGGGRARGGFPVTVFSRMTGGRYTSVRRSDIARAIVDALDEGVETLYGDSVAAIEERGDRVHVSFEHAAGREVDLVVGADGLHSRVRRLAFGARESFELSLGYHVAAFEVAGYPRRDDLVFVSRSIPGRQVSRFSLRGDHTMFLFVLRDEYLPRGALSSDEERKDALVHAYADAGWEAPAILEALRGADDLYFDRVSQVRMERWSRGRVALVGDAAACVSLMAGEGTGLGMTEAYVLAGELHASPEDPGAALARYHERLRALLVRKQASAARFASSFAPRTAFGIGFRNVATRLMRIPWIAERLVGVDLRDNFDLPDYGY